MFGLSHLFDNGLIGLALMAVLVIFVGAIAFAIYSTLRNVQQTGPNFTYVATAIAGLVLSVASGVIGTPATVQLPASTAGLSVPKEGKLQSSGAELKARVTNNQVSDFRNLYAWIYVLAGLACLLVFVLPTPFTHDLVKSVGLTMLGFLITIVGGVVNNGATAGAVGLQPSDVLQLTPVPATARNQSPGISLRTETQNVALHLRERNSEGK
jgi:hypothetical protein